MSSLGAVSSTVALGVGTAASGASSSAASRRAIVCASSVAALSLPPSSVGCTAGRNAGRGVGTATVTTDSIGTGTGEGFTSSATMIGFGAIALFNVFSVALPA